MKIIGSIEINRPREQVILYFADPKYLKEYQEGFINKELVSGQQGQNGAISKMYYKHGKQDMELTETITNNQLPNLFEAHYHHKHMDNTMKCKFIEINNDKTKYEYEIEYTRINWVIPKLISILFPNTYKKPVKKWMQKFKDFVETQSF